MGREIALIVVHGIGSQRPSETIAQYLEQILAVCPTAELRRDSGGPLTLEDLVQERLTEVNLHAPGRKIRVYEVAWADLLPREHVLGTFNKFLFEETSWYPWFNAQCGWLAPDEYPRWLVIARTLQLALSQLVVTPVYEVLPKRWHADILDQVIADVWNYIHSFTGWVKPGSPLIDAADRIIGRFREVAARAVADGFDEIQIVAHSLGTVIAYQSLGNYTGLARSDGPQVPITHLYTLGSPLEKVLFVWTGVLRPELPSPQIQHHGQTLAEGRNLRWRNYYAPLDLVSGALRRFRRWGPVDNIRLRNLGNLATAHTAYYRHPDFLADLSGGLGISQHTAASNRRISFIERVKSAFVNVALPVLLLLASLAGTILSVLVFALAAALGWSVAYLLVQYPLNALLSLFGLHLSYGAVLKAAVAVALAVSMLGLPYFTLVDGYRRARRTHEHWRRSKASQPLLP